MWDIKMACRCMIISFAFPAPSYKADRMALDKVAEKELKAS